MGFDSWWLLMVGCRVRAVGAVTTLEVRRYGVQIPAWAKDFLFSKTSKWALGPIRPRIQWVLRVFFPGIKRLQRETDHSPATNAQVKNETIHLHLYTFMAYIGTSPFSKWCCPVLNKGASCIPRKIQRNDGKCCMSCHECHQEIQNS
jgi:hypothetical protein